MRRKHFLLATGAALAASSVPSIAAGVTKFADLKNGQFGAELNATDISGVQRVLHPEVFKGTVLEVLNAAPSTASAVVLPNLPTVATQGVPGSVGDPGSCEAQSFGYCLGAYTAARHPNGSRKWSAADPENQPSAAWLYQWAHEQNGKSCPTGSGTTPYARKLVSTGSPSAQEYPYNPHDSTTVQGVCSYIKTLDVSNAGPGASRLLVGSYKGFTNVTNGKSRYLDTFKALIRNGHAIAFSGLVAKAYCIESPALQNGAFTAPQGFIKKSGHGQVIVGFDDTKGPNGAFLVQNSFGTTWNPGPANDPGHNGRIWWGYDAFFQSQGYALVMYPNLAVAPSGNKLAATGSGAPDLYVPSVRRHTQDGRHYVTVILHATDAITLTKIDVVGRHGKHAVDTFPTSKALGEMLRFGYASVDRAIPFARGKYTIHVSATTQSGQNVSYSGPIDVT
jgi:hypothetical protein